MVSEEGKSFLCQQFMRQAHDEWLPLPLLNGEVLICQSIGKI